MAPAALGGWELRIHHYLRTSPTPMMPMHWTTRMPADRRCARCGEVLREYGARVSARDVPSCGDPECRALVDQAVGQCNGGLPRWREVEPGLSVCVIPGHGMAQVYRLGPEVLWAYLASPDRGGRLPVAAVSWDRAVKAAEGYLLELLDPEVPG